MKTLFLLILLWPICSTAQQHNIVKLFPTTSVTTIRINNNGNNFKLKVWDEKQVQLSTYIEPSEGIELDKYSFNVKERNGVLKIEVALKNEGMNASAMATPKGNWNKQLKNKQLLKDSLKKKFAKVGDADDEVLVEQITAEAYAMAGNTISAINGNNCTSEDITIMIPMGIPIELTNNSGNGNIETDVDKLLLTCNSGNINTKNINELELDTRFSNFEMGNIKTATINANSSNFTLGNINNLTIDTRFSNYELGDALTINLQSSQSDNFEIETVASLTGSFSFSTFRIQQLTQLLDVVANSGGIKVRNMTAAVSSIKIDGKYADIDLNAKALLSYTLTAKAKYSSIRSNGRTLESTNDEETIRDTKGDGSKTKMNITCNSCSINIK